MNLYRAVVVGATGAVGSALVRELLASSRCARVTILSRRPVDQFRTAIGSEKLHPAVITMADLENQTAELARGCEVAFCTMGIGQPRKHSRDEVWRVDVEYAGAFARGCRTSGVHHIALLSSTGADPGSRNYYLRVKGAAEDAVRAAGLERTSLFRPSLLVTKEARYGLQDHAMRLFFRLFGGMLPARFHQVRVEDLARAMRIHSESDGGGVEILHYPEFGRCSTGCRAAQPYTGRNRVIPSSPAHSSVASPSPMTPFVIREATYSSSGRRRTCRLPSCCRDKSLNNSHRFASDLPDTYMRCICSS